MGGNLSELSRLLGVFVSHYVLELVFRLLYSQLLRRLLGFSPLFQIMLLLKVHRVQRLDSPKVAVVMRVVFRIVFRIVVALAGPLFVGVDSVKLLKSIRDGEALLGQLYMLVSLFRAMRLEAILGILVKLGRRRLLRNRAQLLLSPGYLRRQE